MIDLSCHSQFLYGSVNSADNSVQYQAARLNNIRTNEILIPIENKQNNGKTCFAISITVPWKL